MRFGKLPIVLTFSMLCVACSQPSNQAQQATQPAEMEQPQPELVEDRAVQVPEMPAAHELEHRDEMAAEQPERVSGAELQAGQDAEHPV